MSRIPESELVINPDGSIYHLCLRPEEIATNVITVGDPARVAMVSKYFDRIEHRKEKREFLCHTGYIGQKRFSVISTGIGPDNIDIVINELDALANIDFDNREPKPQHTVLNIVRIGTSGSLQSDIPVDSFVASAYGIGLDNLINFYDYQPNLGEAELDDELSNFLDHLGPLPFYTCECHPELLGNFAKDKYQGITLTSPGFYAPQGRVIRARSKYDVQFFKTLGHFEFKGYRITNFEMETAAIYGLARLLGHRALSTNVILANRADGSFSRTPKESVDALIRNMLKQMSESSLIK